MTSFATIDALRKHADWLRATYDFGYMEAQAKLCEFAADELYRLSTPPSQGKVERAREMREAILSIIPGGDICDPQQIADAIRALPLPVSEDGSGAITISRQGAEAICKRLEFDASWDKTQGGYYELKNGLKSTKHEGDGE
jgi:hypothetical protein